MGSYRPPAEPTEVLSSAVAGEARDVVNTRSQWPPSRSSLAFPLALPWECSFAALPQRRLRLREPERHIHGPVEFNGGGQLGAGLLRPAGLRIQRPSPWWQWASSGPHAECLGQGQGLLVVGFGLRGIGGVGVGMDGAQLVQRMRLVAAFLVLPGQVERLVGVLPGLLAASRQTTDLAEPCDPRGPDVAARPCGDFR